MVKTLLVTSLLSVLPISELRGAIPYAYFNGIPLPCAFLLGVLTNALIPLFGFSLLSFCHRVLSRWKPYQYFYEKIILKAQKKVESKISRNGIIGLALFVGIPLPITGAWTAVLGSWVLGLDRRKSRLACLLGITIAGVIVSLVIYSGSSVASIFTKTVSFC